MNRDEWLELVCKHNVPAQAPNRPFTMDLKGHDYSFATDRLFVAVSAQEKTWPAPPPPNVDAKPHYDVFNGVRETVLKAQGKQKEIGMIDALLLKEMAGDPTWSAEHLAEISRSGPDLIFINGFFSKPVLSRALAAWTEPAGLVYQAPIVKADDQLLNILILVCKDLALFISPCILHDASDADIVELPEGALLLK